MVREITARKRSAGLALLLAWVAVGRSRVEAQPSPNGDEFQVNTYTTGNQFAPTATFDGQGRSIVVWQSAASSGTDNDGASIQAQRYAANGTPLGGQFQINSYTTGYQNVPAVAMGPLGNFVVVWDSAGSSGTDSSSYSIQAQRFAANGNPIGGQFQVNSYTTSWQIYARAAADALGNFVVIWESLGSAGTDNSSFSIHGRRYAANGSPLGSDFQINTYTTGGQRFPAVASDSDGNFVVVWQSEGSNGSDSSYKSIQGQRYAEDGTALGDEFQVNAYSTGHQQSPEVAMDPAGNFIAAWDSNGSSGTDTSTSSIQVRRYNLYGEPLDPEFQVNTYTSSSQSSPSLATDADGRFVVVWHSRGSNGTDTSSDSVQGRRYAANGVAQGDQFQVNSYTTSYQFFPTVASAAGGEFVVAWPSSGSSGTDTSGFSIQAQRFDAIFRDGFESGDTSHWSATLP